MKRKRKGNFYETEQGPCVCCGIPSHRLDNIFGSDMRASLFNANEFWYLCPAHLREKRQYGLIKFASWHPAAIQTLKEKGYDETARIAEAESVVHMEAFL